MGSHPEREQERDQGGLLIDPQATDFSREKASQKDTPWLLPLRARFCHGLGKDQNMSQDETVKLAWQLPSFYQKAFPASLWRLDPVETKATCETCAMAKPRRRKAPFYDEKLKCCTFHPFLPNYIVGGLLLSEKESEKKAQNELRRKIREREYALPIGLVAPIPYQVAFNKERSRFFGQKQDWLCPYYDRESENCGIWRSRGSVCTSFYCISDHGARGLKFWAHLENYLSYLEMCLLQECLTQFGFSPRQVSDQLGFLNRTKATAQELKSWTLSPQQVRRIWGHVGEGAQVEERALAQEEFYKKCYHHVLAMDRKALSEALGEQGRELLREVEKWSRCKTEPKK